jgi:hypothetical protein
MFLKKEPDTERYTPPEIVAAVRETLGDIDLDPCTTELVNNTFIRAKQWYTETNNGLDREKPWQSRVFINPPGNNPRGDGINKPRQFWERLVIEYKIGNVKSGIYLAYNLEFLQRCQHWDYCMTDFPFCIPKNQLRFYREKNGRLAERDYPEFASAIIYVGKNVKRFAKAFDNIGTIIIPRNT